MAGVVKRSVAEEAARLAEADGITPSRLTTDENMVITYKSFYTRLVHTRSSGFDAGQQSALEELAGRVQQAQRRILVMSLIALLVTVVPNVLLLVAVKVLL